MPNVASILCVVLHKVIASQAVPVSMVMTAIPNQPVQVQSVIQAANQPSVIQATPIQTVQVQASCFCALCAQFFSKIFSVFNVLTCFSLHIVVYKLSFLACIILVFCNYPSPAL